MDQRRELGCSVGSSFPHGNDDGDVSVGSAASCEEDECSAARHLGFSVATTPRREAARSCSTNCGGGDVPGAVVRRRNLDQQRELGCSVDTTSAEGDCDGDVCDGTIDSRTLGHDLDGSVSSHHHDSTKDNDSSCVNSPSNR